MPPRCIEVLNSVAVCSLPDSKFGIWVRLFWFHRGVALVSWSTPFDEPIEPENGIRLTTLRDAIQYLAKTVPKAEQNHEKVLIAADHLTRSAEQGYPLFFARIATLQAIHRHRQSVFNPDRKDHHWGRRKLKRDR